MNVTKTALNDELRAKTYPELKFGRLLFQCGEFPSHQEYILLDRNDDSRFVKILVNSQGTLKDDQHVIVEPLKWDLPNMTTILQLVKKEFHGEELVEKNSLLTLLKKYLGHDDIIANPKRQLVVKDCVTKFSLHSIAEAVAALAKLIPQRNAERLICKEIAAKIKNVL